MGIGAIAGILFYVNEQWKYSDERKYDVMKAAMLQKIVEDPNTYPLLDLPEQTDMIRNIVFSDTTQLVLVEGAQGIAVLFILARPSMLTCMFLFLVFT